MERIQRTNSISHTSQGLCKLLEVIGLAVVLALPAGCLFGAVANEVIKVLGIREITRRFREERVTSDQFYQCFAQLNSFHWSITAVIYSFLVAKAMASLASRVTSDVDGSRLKQLCVSAPVSLLGLSVTGLVLGAIEENLRATFAKNFPYSIVPLHGINSLFLYLFASCQGNIVFQTAVLAVYTASYIPSGIICLHFVDIFNLEPAVSLLFMIILVILNLLLFLRITLRTVSSSIHFIPCIILMLIMVVSSDSPIAITRITTDKRDSIIIGVMTTHLLAAGLGASINTLLGINEESYQVCVGALVGGGTIVVAVRKASFSLGTWGRLGALLGVSGAAGLALSAAGVAAQRYGERIDESERTGETEERERRTGEAEERERRTGETGETERRTGETGERERRTGETEDWGGSEGDSDGHGEERQRNEDVNDQKYILKVSVGFLIMELNMTLMICGFELVLRALEIGHLIGVLGTILCALAWVIVDGLSLYLLNIRTKKSTIAPGSMAFLRRAGLGLEELITEWCVAIREVGREGILARVSVALAAGGGAFLSAGGQRSGGQDGGRLGAFVAVCAAVIPLTSYRPTKST